MSAMQMVDMEPWQGRPTEIIRTNSYSGSGTPPDDKPHRPGGLWESLTTVVESVSWQLLYATSGCVGYKLLLTLQDGSYPPQPFLWTPLVATVVVIGFSRSHWNPGLPTFNPLDEQASGQQHGIQIITLMDNPGGGHSSSTWTWGAGQSLNMYSGFTGYTDYSFASHLDGYYGDDPGWPTPPMHSYDEQLPLRAMSGTAILYPCPQTYKST